MKRYMWWKSNNDFNRLPPPAAIQPGDARSAGLRNSKHIALLSEQMGWMDGWFICDFTSFSAVFQSYQDDGTDDDERIFAMEPRLMRGWNPEPQDQ